MDELRLAVKELKRLRKIILAALNGLYPDGTRVEYQLHNKRSATLTGVVIGVEINNWGNLEVRILRDRDTGSWVDNVSPDRVRVTG